MKVNEEERALLLAEVTQALDQIRSPELRVAYGELLTALDQKQDIPEELYEPLQNLLAVGLESGRIRAVHTAHGEMAAQRVYHRTPAGRGVRESTEAVNAALQALKGQAVDEISVSPGGPGTYVLTVATDEGKLLIKLSRHGAHLQSMEVGG
ncbi:MAG: hypothetical protein ACK47B_22945 [Armatimonadota bacterium]